MALNVGDRRGHYEVTALIGKGGMGQVYRARDTSLDRDVALKVLPDELASDPEALKRLQQEARALAALNHPNVVTIHSVEEAGSGHFLVMELVEGDALSELIAEPLSVGRFFEVAVPLVNALAAAHDAGITHRDLKPSNVMVTPTGHIKVLDFGLAKVVGPRPDLESTLTHPLTQAGAAVGTVPYMSPEQLESKAVDHRSDIFSLGIMMYEMMSGHRPFEAESGAGLASAILRDDPPSLAATRPDLPASLGRIIERCLQKTSERRYQTTAELLDALQLARQEHESGGAVRVAAPVKPDTSIAVLPFTSVSADPENEFFSDGISEEIINALGRIEHLRVAGRTSAFSFKGRNVDVRDIGRQLNVTTVLEGSVRKSGNRLRITAELVDVSNGYQLWTERYDREQEDIFAVQDDIARSISERLEVTLATDHDIVEPNRPTESLEAYQLYLKGRTLLNRRGLSIPPALECLKQVVALDPNYALAWAGLADAHSIFGQYGFVPANTTMPQAKAAALRAVELDDSLAEAHCALGGALLFHDFDVGAAEREFRRALEISPDYIQARWWYALFALCWTRGKFDEAVTHSAVMRELDPLSSSVATIHALTLAFAGRYDEAVETANEAIAREPESYIAHWALQFAALLASRFADALQAGDAAMAVSGRHPWSLALQVSAHMAVSHRDAARAGYDELVARSASVYVQPFGIAWSAAAVGLTEEAVAHTERALADRDTTLLMGIRHYPHAEPLRQALRDAGKLDEILAGISGPEA